MSFGRNSGVGSPARARQEKQKRISTFKVEKDSIPTAPWLTLTNDNGGHDYDQVSIPLKSQGVDEVDAFDGPPDLARSWDFERRKRKAYPFSSSQAFPS